MSTRRAMRSRERKKGTEMPGFWLSWLVMGSLSVLGGDIGCCCCPSRGRGLARAAVLLERRTRGVDNLVSKAGRKRRLSRKLDALGRRILDV